jgi:hypothetical protein
MVKRPISRKIVHRSNYPDPMQQIATPPCFYPFKNESYKLILTYVRHTSIPPFKEKASQFSMSFSNLANHETLNAQHSGRLQKLRL